MAAENNRNLNNKMSYDPTSVHPMVTLTCPAPVASQTTSTVKYLRDDPMKLQHLKRAESATSPVDKVRSTHVGDAAERAAAVYDTIPTAKAKLTAVEIINQSI